MKKILSVFSSISALLLMSTPVYAQDQIITISPPPNLKILELGTLVSALIGAILFIAALAAFMYLLLGGFQWITSGGDKAGVEAAQKRIQAAIIGLIIVFASWALMKIIGQFLGIPDIFKFELPSAAGP